MQTLLKSYKRCVPLFPGQSRIKGSLLRIEIDKEIEGGIEDKNQTKILLSRWKMIMILIYISFPTMKRDKEIILNEISIKKKQKIFEKKGKLNQKGQ